mgnify:CR=1 FL=1
MLKVKSEKLLIIAAAVWLLAGINICLLYTSDAADD